MAVTGSVRAKKSFPVAIALTASLIAQLAFFGARSTDDGIGVIITGRNGVSDARDAVAHVGGTVSLDLPIVDGVAASVPGASIERLARLAAVRTVTLDRPVRLLSAPLKSVYSKVMRATDTWATGVTGAGVTVALIDTGIADVPDLAGRVLPVTDDITGETSPCVNLSGEPDCADSYGHGTFLAGIIAGNGAASGGAWKGVAPAANLVSLKIAGRDGAADVSNVLAAIQWVVSFKDRYGIRVLNLSLGTDSTQSWRVDPFNYAVERAWAAGIVVVVSASNRGPDAQTIAKPGDDPWVITVGAIDDDGSVGVGDDLIPDFSSRGPTAEGVAKPDVVAPGSHMISLRAPGSEIDTRFPSYVDGSYRKGSGTSMAAAAVSGAAALMASADPSITPDRAKYALMATARPAASTDPMTVGAGVVDVPKAIDDAPAGLANQGLDRSNGTGTIDASRGTLHVQTDDPLATVVGAALTTQLLVFDPIAYMTGDWDGAKWYGAKWYGAKWYGAKWYGAKWYGTTWSGAKWYGAKWYGETNGAKWYGSEWQGAKWYGAWE